MGLEGEPGPGEFLGRSLPMEFVRHSSMLSVASASVRRLAKIVRPARLPRKGETWPDRRPRPALSERHRPIVSRRGRRGPPRGMRGGRSIDLGLVWQGPGQFTFALAHYLEYADPHLQRASLSSEPLSERGALAACKRPALTSSS